MGIKDFRVLVTMSQIARHQFLDEAFDQEHMKVDLYIGYKQTISQPYIVARMTELLIEKPVEGEKILKMMVLVLTQAAKCNTFIFAEEVIGIERRKATNFKKQMLFKFRIKNLNYKWR